MQIKVSTSLLLQSSQTLLSLYMSLPIKSHCRPYKTNVHLEAQRRDLPFTKSVQTGKYFGVLVTVQAYATNQKLLVNLTDHRTWDVGAFTGHPRPLTYGSTLHTAGVGGRKKKERRKMFYNLHEIT